MGPHLLLAVMAVPWLEVLACPDLGRRIVVLVGPLTALHARGVSRPLSEAWKLDVVSDLGRAGAWKALLPSPPSLHTLLGRYSRKSSGPGTFGGGGAGDQGTGSPVNSGLFDTAFSLLSMLPQAAEEPQQLARADEECSVEENMGRSPLIVAARCGLVGVAWLIARHCPSEGAGLNERDAMGCSALRYAIVNKDERMCRCLLGFDKVDLEVPDARGDTALLQAVGANAPAVCRMLLERSANPAFTNRGQTALDLADALGYEGCAAILRAFGAPSARCLPAQNAHEVSRCGDGQVGSLDSESELDDEVRESERGQLVTHAELSSAVARRLSWDALLRDCSNGSSQEPQEDWELSDDDLDDLDEEDGARAQRRRLADGTATGGSRGPPQPRRPHRWDMGGLFIKTRGGQSQRWHG